MKLEREEIDKIFKESKHQVEVLEGLYRLVYPDLDDIHLIINYPQISKELNLYITGKFIEFDRIHHPDVLNGGLWMNKGFSHRESIDGDVVIPAKVIMKSSIMGEETDEGVSS